VRQLLSTAMPVEFFVDENNDTSQVNNELSTLLMALESKILALCVR
jgi:hypothetical protein